MNRTTIGAVSAVLVAVLIGGVVLLSGGNDAAAETDGAFLTEMTPHHEGAIEMARIAEERAQHPEIRNLASDIIAAQEAEIAQIDSIHQRLFDEPVTAVDHGTLGLDDQMMGMAMDTGTLGTAKPFDRAFIDMMIPHHQGAIQMARVELTSGADQETKGLAADIIEAQSSEIEAMNRWRKDWYGAESPAGGVPN